MEKVSLFWFRRDLRLFDNPALSAALSGEWPVLPVFIFDTNILDSIEDRADRRVNFIYREAEKLKKAIEQKGGRLEIHFGSPAGVFQFLTEKYRVAAVFANTDYEPYARKRDTGIEQLLASKGIAFCTFKDHVIFEKSEILKDDGTPYTVFTPYSKKWKTALGSVPLKEFSLAGKWQHLLKEEPAPMPSLESMGFQKSRFDFPNTTVENDLLEDYTKTRDFPARDGTSRLGLHLRFGTISIRQLVAQARSNSETFLNELVWREFFQMILWHFPKVVSQCFKPAYETIEWRNDEVEFHAWCEGRTGYPLVDAGMRELNATGFMHNRVRMVAASFLTKHLLTDWRWGEAYFATKLLDYELASNNGNWQWAAGTGCDAAPYFRIFSPASQAKKFDPKEAYLRKWVPELETRDYPPPIVEHQMARKRVLEAYQRALTKHFSDTAIRLKNGGIKYQNS
ncbi:MAG: deoxyribodipyrimidine photo-lyase [Saprospiraceae bacterium]|nr:MAG: deoxyribodipyrimidine photo-lyase [Saprospiraceae bacterium]